MDEKRYWGIYFPKADDWLKESSGQLFFYPAAEIAEAHLRSIQRYFSWKDGVVTEFGKQEPITWRSDGGLSEHGDPWRAVEELRSDKT